MCYYTQVIKVNFDALGSLVDVDDVDLDYHRTIGTDYDGDFENEETIDIIFKYYRKRGFPYYEYSEYEKLTEMRKLRKLSCEDYISDGIVRQTMHGLGLAWSYFPHSWSVRCNDKKSPMDAFTDDESFKKVIRKCLMFRAKYDGKLISDMYLRKILKIATGVQGVSNFRPTAAASIYEKYAGDGVVWDMSCGWGGRLVGAMMSNRVKKYIGTDPSTLTFNGLCRMRDDFSYLGKEVELHCMGSETYLPQPSTLDLCFTSPPYFDTERYSTEDTQSYKKFSTYEDWLEGFWKQTMLNCKHGLKTGGHMLLNVADVGKYKLETATQSIARKLGFVQEEDLNLALSALNTGGFKYEPVFVFRKNG